MSGPDLQEDSGNSAQPQSQSSTTVTVAFTQARGGLYTSPCNIRRPFHDQTDKMSSQKDSDHPRVQRPPEFPSHPEDSLPSLVPVLSNTDSVSHPMIVPPQRSTTPAMAISVSSPQTHIFTSQTSTTSTVSSGGSEVHRRDSGYITEPSPFPHSAASVSNPVTFFVENEEEEDEQNDVIEEDSVFGNFVCDSDQGIMQEEEYNSDDTFASNTNTLERRSNAITIPSPAEIQLVQQYLPCTPPRAYMCQNSLHMGAPSNRAARMSTGSMPRTLSMVLQDRAGQRYGGISLPGSPSTQNLMHAIFSMQEDALSIQRLRCHLRDQQSTSRARTLSESTAPEDDHAAAGPPVPRNRSNTMPTLPCLLERNFGQELRRISDEFHMDYATQPRHSPRPASYPGSRGQRQQPWWQLIIQVLSPRQRHYEETLSEESISQVVEAGKCSSDATRFHRDNFPPH